MFENFKGPIGRKIRNVMAAGAIFTGSAGLANAQLSRAPEPTVEAQPGTQAKVKKMEGLLKQAELDLKQAKRAKTPDQNTIDTAEDDVAKAKTNLEQAKGEYKDAEKHGSNDTFDKRKAKQTEGYERIIEDIKDDKGNIIGTKETIRGSKNSGSLFIYKDLNGNVVPSSQIGSSNNLLNKNGGFMPVQGTGGR